MKLFVNLLSIITGLMLFSTLVCGLWIKANSISDPSSLQFHSTIGIISVVLSFILIVTLMILIKKYLM